MSVPGQLPIALAATVTPLSIRRIPNTEQYAVTVRTAKDQDVECACTRDVALAAFGLLGRSVEASVTYRSKGMSELHSLAPSRVA
jgi:hypothetical protein